MNNASNRELIETAIRVCGGTQVALAKKIGGKCRQGHVFKWLNSQRVTAEVATAIEQATGGAVSRAELRPDLFADQQRAA